MRTPPRGQEYEAAAGSAGACPVSAEDDATEEARRRARRAAEARGGDPAAAEAMALAALRQRAEDREAEPSPEFVARLGAKLGYGHPLSERTGSLSFTWTPEAEARLAEVPDFCRELTRWRVEWTAHKLNLGNVITPEVMQAKYDRWGEVSAAIQQRDGEALPWSDSARQRLGRVPDFVRGQVVQAVEGAARGAGLDVVDDEVLDQAIGRWRSTGDFHAGRFGFR